MGAIPSEDELSAPSVLSPAYYRRLFELEEAHGWQRGMASYNDALLAPVVSMNRGLRVLDAGCGTGGVITWLRNRGAEIVGMDLALDGLKHCQRRGHRSLAQGSVLDLPFADASFDLVISTDVLQHLPSPPGDAAALAESRRVLRPGGSLYVRTNSMCGESGPVERSSTYRRYTRQELARRVSQAGFTVQRCTYANAIPSLPTVLRRRQRRQSSADQHHAHGAHDHGVGGDPGLSLTLRPASRRWIDTVLATILRLEAWVVATHHAALDLPFGDSLILLATTSRPSDAPNGEPRNPSMLGRIGTTAGVMEQSS